MKLAALKQQFFWGGGLVTGASREDDEEKTFTALIKGPLQAFFCQRENLLSPPLFFLLK